MSPVLFQAIDSLLEQKSMLKHPFYQAWDAGTLTREMLKEYACQYNYFVEHFPRMVSAVHSNTPDLAIRQELLLNLVDEENGPENHPALWKRFAYATGATEDDLGSAPPLPTTTSLVETMMDLCRNGSFQEGAASLYAYESQIPEVSRVKIDGLARHYGVTDPDAVKFFTVHQEADVYHSRAEREMIERNTPEELYGRTREAAGKTADALWRFLDGVYETYVRDTIVTC